MPTAVKGMPALAGKVVAVTGASGGIGEIVVKTMVKYGCIVKGVDIEKASEKMGAMQKEYGNKTFSFYTANLLNADECSSLPSKVGDIDMLVNAAGLAKISPLMEQTAQDWDLTMNLNAKAVFLVCQAFARQWIAQEKAGSIVNISSQASNAPLPGHMTYCASKACVDMITRMLAMELGPHNIRVNAVNPTVVLTDMGRANWSDPKVAGPMLSSIPLNRFAEPDEVSEAIAWLLTDAAGMINGHLLPIDGGFLACRSNLMSKI